MNVIIRTIADWLYQQGKASAGMASIHGVYEAPVPLQMLEQNKK